MFCRVGNLNYILTFICIYFFIRNQVSGNLVSGMWLIFFFSCVVANVTSDKIKVECGEATGFPPTCDTSPSLVADLKLELVKVGEKDMVNISWAINIDSSVTHLIGTRIVERSVHLCKYSPPFAMSNLTGSQQVWFHYLVRARYGSNLIQVANLPLPPLGSGPSYKNAMIDVPSRRVTPKPTPPPAIVEMTTDTTTSDKKNIPTSISWNIFSGLAGVMILCLCCLIYKRCGTNFAKSLGLKRVPTMVPVSVLMVYPPENVALQRAIMALAHFLQCHAGCNVAIDMWQQGKIAELGPMRWLAEQVKVTERVLIICPQSSSQPSHSPPNPNLPELSIPAAAHDLYPLILNLVASHSKNATELSKFWVVQLGKKRHKNPSNLAPELRACKRFWLMEDLNKLCCRLCTQNQDDQKKRSASVFRPGVAYSGRSTVKLREAVEELSGHKPVIP